MLNAQRFFPLCAISLLLSGSTWAAEEQATPPLVQAGVAHAKVVAGALITMKSVEAAPEVRGAQAQAKAAEVELKRAKAVVTPEAKEGRIRAASRNVLIARGNYTKASHAGPSNWNPATVTPVERAGFDLKSANHQLTQAKGLETASEESRLRRIAKAETEMQKTQGKLAEVRKLRPTRRALANRALGLGVAGLLFVDAARQLYEQDALFPLADDAIDLVTASTRHRAVASEGVPVKAATASEADARAAVNVELAQ